LFLGEQKRPVALLVMQGCSVMTPRPKAGATPRDDRGIISTLVYARV